MEEIKKKFEKFKNFQIEQIIKKDSYINVLVNDNYYQAFLKEIKSNNKYEINYLITSNKLETKNNLTFKDISFLGFNNLPTNNNIREIIFNDRIDDVKTDTELNLMILNRMREIYIDLNLINNEIDKFNINEQKYRIVNLSELEKDNPSLIIKDEKGEEYNITGYYTMQFFSGFLIDVIVYINNKLSFLLKESKKEQKDFILDDDFKKIIHILLNLIIFVLSIMIKHIEIIKECLQFNRKILIIDKISSILASLEIILSNVLIIFCYRFYENIDIEEKLVIISQLCYDILINNNNRIPIGLFLTLINFITYEDNMIRIINFDKNKVYMTFANMIQNLNETDIKYIKNFTEIKNSCYNIVTKLYKKEIKVLINNCYYNFLINSLTKSNILEKKIGALNFINDIIINMFEKENEINQLFYDFFFNKNKILDIFFEDTVHNEILKRSIELFKYLSTYEKLENGLINKLIKLDNNNNIIVRNILCEIIKRIKNAEEKTDLFMKITKDFNFDDNNNQNNIIDFVTKLTLACFYSQENRADLENDITNGYSSNNDSFSNKNDINDNVSFSKKSNIQIVKISGIMKNNSSFRNGKISRNISVRSMERINNEERRENMRFNINRKVNSKRKYYYGLDMLFKYILFTYDVKKALDNNNLNISKAIRAFKYILDSTNAIKMNDTYHFLKELLENIQTNKKHNSVVQSLILVEILLNKLQKGNNEKNDNAFSNNKMSSISNVNIEENEAIVHQLDEKYDIITLISDDLIRYVQEVNNNNKNKNNFKEKIFEGIYNYMDNISIRLKLLFIFVYFDLNLNEQHFKKLYNLFKGDDYQEERILLFKELSNNIYYIKNNALKKIFTEIFQDNNEFNRSKFEEVETFYLIRDLFIAINLMKHSLLDDLKAIKVNAELNKIEGMDFLFDILITNRCPLIIQRICNMLSHYCFYLSSYKKDFPSKYWTSFINKITLLMEECNKTKNIEGIYALAKLTESIYYFNFSWRIPGKEDVHEIGEAYSIYQFCCPDRGNKSYKLKVGRNDKLHQMRWKLAYYFDLYVNDVVICDLDDNKYNLLYDDNKFHDLFPPRKYNKNGIHLEYIKVYEQPNQLLTIPNNTSQLIEKNETIINILIDNLKEETEDDIIKGSNFLLIKKELWNILEKLPKQKYTELLINKFDSKKSMNIDDLKEIINFDEIFVLTYNLQCFISFLSSDSEEKDVEKVKHKNNFLNIFTNFYHLDKILYSDFTNKDINKYLNDKNTQFIYFEYIKQILIIIQMIEEFKMKKNILYMSINKKLEKEKILSNSKNDFDLNNTNITSMNELKESILDIIGNKVFFNTLTGIIIFILNDTSIDNNEICFQIVQEIIKLVDILQTTNNTINNNYFEFIFEAEILFKKIFIYDFIKSTKDQVKNLLSDFLLTNLFESNSHSSNLRYNLEEDKDEEKKKNNDNKNIKTFFDIILSPEIFSFLVNNQKDGSYFNIISKMIEKYINNKKKIINIQNTQKDIKKIIELIITCLNDKDNILKINDVCLLNYPFTGPSVDLVSKENIGKNKNDFINGILLYLLRILELSEECHPIIDYFLSSIDVCNFFLIKGVLNKCNSNPLFSEETPYSNFNSHKIIFQILIFILKYLNNTKNILENKKYLDDSLYMIIWQILNKYHKLEFWQNSQDFQMNFNDKDKKEFIGLRNMSSTCYMNSILQQFFMIPMLRETILSINSDKQDTILYQLQLTFTALKAYEFKYYDPKYFVTVSNLSFYEQMDADEYYGLLVDRLETDINNLSKENSNNNSKNYQNLFKYFLGIKLTDELYFVECNHKRYNESLSYNIQLEVKNFNNIDDSLKNYFKTEIMSGDNKIICEECKTKRVCHKKLKIKALPNILVISLKRFDYDYRNMTKFKLNNYFEFPFELNMSEFLMNKNETQEKSENQNTIYELTGITIHYGVSDYGHYYDLIKAVNNKWYKFNDTNITEFSENDIPREAFGDKESETVEIEEEIADKAEVKEKENKNAYILIYTKKSFIKSNINNNSINANNEYNTKLIYPPYNKMSNINPSIKSYINYKMFKYWTLENLADSNYQNFILELLKLDLVKNINNEISAEHITLIDDLKSGGYLPIKNYINTGITIFSFGLIYYCNILSCSPKEKNIAKLFLEILIVYLENDPKKCVFVLEEFSGFDIIDKFIFSCHKDEVKNDMIELVSNAFLNLFESQENSENKENKYINILVKYLNSIILFIEKNKNIAFHNVSYFDNIAQLFYKLVYKKKIYMNYMKNNAIDKWLNDIMIIIEEKQNEPVNTIDTKNYDDLKNGQDKADNSNINENHFPKLESTHCLLKEKTEDFNFGFKFNKKIEINALKSKILPKKNYDGIVFMKLLLEDFREMK